MVNIDQIRRIGVFFSGVVLICFILSSGCLAQPFGIAEGTPTTQLQIEEDRGDYFYIIKPPKTHSNFEAYTALSTPEQGVCRLSGLGFTLENDAYGNRARDLFQFLTDQLSSKYGKSKIFDYLRVGSIWREPQEWAISINKNERSYNRYWDKEEKSTLSSGLRSVTLSTKALDSNRTYIVITYEFDNIDKCMAKRKAVGSGIL